MITLPVAQIFVGHVSVLLFIAVAVIFTRRYMAKYSSVPAKVSMLHADIAMIIAALLVAILWSLLGAGNSITSDDTWLPSVSPLSYGFSVSIAIVAFPAFVSVYLTKRSRIMTWTYMAILGVLTYGAIEAWQRGLYAMGYNGCRLCGEYIFLWIGVHTVWLAFAGLALTAMICTSDWLDKRKLRARASSNG